MTNEQILEQVAKFERGLSNPSIPDGAKETIKKKIQELKGQLVKAEEKVEKKEEKIEKDEKKVKEDLQAVIDKFEKGLKNPNIPEGAKDSIRKKIAAAKEELAKAEKEMKADKKEAEAEKKEIKKVVEKVEKIAKLKTPVKGQKKPKAPAKIAMPKVKEKVREGKAHKRKEKLKELTGDLQDLIKKNKFLSEKYKGTGESRLERDAKRSAKPFGYRFVGEHDYRVPTEAQIKAGKKRGTIDYEGRANRSDKYPKAKVKLADGGMMAKGGMEYKKGGKVGTSVSDKHRFAKPAGWRFKDSAEGKTLDGKKIKRADLSHAPSKKIRAKYPKYVAFEDRLNKSDAHPTRSSKDSI